MRPRTGALPTAIACPARWQERGGSGRLMFLPCSVSSADDILVRWLAQLYWKPKLTRRLRTD